MEPMPPVSDTGYARAAAGTECAQLRAELAELRRLATLRDELDQRRRAEFKAIVEVVADYSKDALDQVTGLTERVLAELFDSDGRFAALQARIDGVLPDPSARSRARRRGQR